jgi:uncharacterized membrane protein YidH (DUF202 family)
MEPNKQNSIVQNIGGGTKVTDFFLNLGAIVALYTVVVSLLNLLFTVINTAYPQINSGYYYDNSASISFPVATLVIFFPIFILLMWFLEKGYAMAPEKRHLGIRKWLTYVTLFVAGLTLAGDLVTILYYFIDGQELTAGFILKVISVFAVALCVFLYYISDIREKLSAQNRKIWLFISIIIVLGSIIWGFSVLGSPRTQQLLKYDTQKVNDLQNINGQINSYWQMKGVLPTKLDDLSGPNNYFTVPTDTQNGKVYEYRVLTGTKYELCAEFNKDSNINSKNVAQTQIYPYQPTYWNHPAGRFCFSQIIDSKMYPYVPAVNVVR